MIHWKKKEVLRNEEEKNYIYTDPISFRDVELFSFNPQEYSCLFLFSFIFHGGEMEKKEF